VEPEPSSTPAPAPIDPWQNYAPGTSFGEALKGPYIKFGPLNPDGAAGPVILTPPGISLRPDRRREDRDRGGLPGSDAQGDFILNHWLDGSGKEVDLFYDEGWSNYMRANKLLQREAREEIKKDALTRKESGPVNIRFHGEIENGYKTGYELLHGSKGKADRGEWKDEDQGDVQMVGYATVDKKPDGKTEIRYGLNTTWNDIIDPNPKYILDTIASAAMHIVYSPRDYKIKIRWFSGANVEIDGTTVTGRGWPFDSNETGGGPKAGYPVE